MAFEKLLVQFLVVVVAVVAGLFVYERWLKPQPQPQVVTAPSPLISGELEAERAMVDRSGLRGEVVAAISPLKVAIAEFYLSNGQWPGSLAQLGVGDRGFTGKWLSKVELGANGQIRLERQASAGGGQMLLHPAEQGGSLRWNCTSDWPDAALIFPGCDAR